MKHYKLKYMKSNPQQIKYREMKSIKKIKYIEGSKKYIIKWMRVKIKIKNKLEDKPEVSIGGLDWNEKYLWLKKKQIKRMRVKLEKQ
jgi:hypothetical protein